MRKGGSQCAACYMRKYRSTTKGKQAAQAAHKRWRQRDGNAHYWDREYKRAWRRRNHQHTPADLKALRQAVKRLEQALASANGRESASGPS